MYHKKNHQSMAGHGDMCHCCMCACGMGHMHGHFGFWVVKLLVALVVLLFVFWLGVKVGEVKSFVGIGRFGTRSNMMYYGNGTFYDNGSYGTPGSPVIVPQGGMMRTQTYIASSTPAK